MSNTLNIFIEPFVKYAEFDGRSNRQSFIVFQVVHITMILFSAISDYQFNFYVDDTSIGIFLFVTLLLLMIPSIAITIRRLHDLDKSGFYYFLFFIPYVNFLFYVYLIFAPGTKHANQFGPIPT